MIPVAKIFRRWREILAIAALALVYFIAGKHGLTLALVHKSATAVWPPSGIALAVLLLWGRWLWPGVFIGAFLVNVTTAGSVLTSLGIATGNTLESVLGAWLVNRFAGGRRAFAHGTEVFRFAGLGAAVSTTVAATIGVTTLCLGGVADWAKFDAVWVTWWLGDTAGDLMVAPAIILWAVNPSLQWTRRQFFEAVLLLLCLLSAAWLIFGGVLQVGSQSLPPAMVSVPILLWAAFRFGQREAASATLLLSAIAVVGTLQGSGPFVRPNLNDGFLVLGTYMSMMSLTGLAVAAEIQERKRHQKFLSLQAETLREHGRLLDLAPVLVRDMEGVITLWTNGAERLYGWTRAETVGKVAETLLQTQFPEPAAEIHAKLLAEGRWEGELVHKTRDGKQVFVASAWVLHRTQHGTPAAVLEVSNDISERKRAERRLAAQHALTRALAEAATLHEAVPQIIQAICESLDWEAGAVWIRDPGSDTLRCLELWHPPSVDLGEFGKVTRETRFARGAGLPGQIWASESPVWIPDLLVPPFPVVRAPWMIAAGLRGAFGFVIRSDREVCGVVEFFSRQVREPDDRLLTMCEAIGLQVGLFVERKRAEEERDRLLTQEQAARAEAEGANRAKDDFLAVVSHEIRTPLTAILGWARLLRTAKLDKAAAATAMETIERNAKLQAKIIEDLLSISRMIAGKVRLDFRPLDLSRVVETSVDTARMMAESKGVRLLVDLDRAPVAGDSERLQQIVSNLVSNAVKFTPEGGTVEIRLERAGSHAQITVSDTGPGIPPDFLPHLFKPFRQAESSAGRAHGGLGLGLAITHRLVELHGGTAEGMNRVDQKGAIFRVRLPLRAAGREAPPAADRGRTSRASSMLAGIRVLVVDDNADARDLIDRLLRERKAEVTAVGSAREALQALMQLRPDVLVSDLAMPGESGYVLIEKVRSLEPEQGGATPAIAVTAFAGPEDRERALQAGFQAHLPKPIDPDKLAQRILHLATARSTAEGQVEIAK